MSKAYNLIDLLIFRTWHVSIPVIPLVIAYAVGIYFPNYKCNTYKIIGTGMQVIGALIFLSILNKNMVSIKNTTVLKELKSWIQEIISTLYNKPLNISISDAAIATTGVGLDAILIKKVGNTNEERIKILEEEMDMIRKNINDIKNDLMVKINETEVKNNNKFDNVFKDLGIVRKNLETVLVGNYKGQIFSVFLIVFGLILTIIPCNNP